MSRRQDDRFEVPTVELIVRYSQDMPCSAGRVPAYYVADLGFFKTSSISSKDSRSRNMMLT
jgi:hypothetical protein